MQCLKPIAPRGDLVPCGYCYVCRQNRLSDWVVRLQHEQQNSICSYFVTLTYNEYNLPLNDEGDSCLVKRDLQLWLKRLRKLHSVRYYAVGEYGTKYGRAHYHAILFSSTPIAFDTLVHTWKNGFVHLGNVNTKSISYVAKYVFTNKSDGGKNRPPQFALMSRRPGIGFHKVVHLPKRNFVYLNGHKKRLPRYYKDKLLSKEEKNVMKEKTLSDVERLYQEELQYLRDKGYSEPVSEYAIREQQYLTKVMYTDKSKLKF